MIRSTEPCPLVFCSDVEPDERDRSNAARLQVGAEEVRQSMVKLRGVGGPVEAWRVLRRREVRARQRRWEWRLEREVTGTGDDAVVHTSSVWDAPQDGASVVIARRQRVE